MTPEQKIEYHKEVKEAMFEFLHKNNLIDAENMEIMANLQDMYRYLEDKGLIKYGLTWPMFELFASQQFTFQMLQGNF